MSLSSLPEEIHAEVLVRLPVKSILTCKCVFKLWRNLVCSSNFIKFHLNIQRNNPMFMFNEHHLDTKNRMNLMYSIDHASLSSSSDLSSQHVRTHKVTVLKDNPFDHEETAKVSIDIVGSCNGLLCLLLMSSGYKENSICIWNPSTMEYKKIPVDPLRGAKYGFGHIDGRFEVKYGFGYDYNNDDYKVVRIANYEKSGSFTIQVYTLGLDLWKSIELTPQSFFIFWDIPGLLFKGALHWKADKIPQRPYSEIIVSFDISNYRFVDVPFPEKIMPLPFENKFTRTLGVLNDCLCLVEDDCGVHTDIWVMQEYGVRESWTKRFTTTRSEITNNCLLRMLPFKNGILMYDGVKIFLLDKEMDSLLSINVFPERTNIYNTDAVNHIESLVSLHSGTYFGKRIIKEEHEAKGSYDSDYQDALFLTRRFDPYKKREVEFYWLTAQRDTHDLQAE